MTVVIACQPWHDMSAATVAQVISEAWSKGAAVPIQTVLLGDGGPRSGEALGAPAHQTEMLSIWELPTPIGEATRLLIGPREGDRWNVRHLIRELVELDEQAGGSRITVPLGDDWPSDWYAAQQLSGGVHWDIPLDLEPFRSITLDVLVTSHRPLLGFKGLAGSLVDERKLPAEQAQGIERAWFDASLVLDKRQRGFLLGGSRLSDVAGTGAAGGLAYVLAAAGGRVVQAGPYLAELAGLERSLEEAELAVVAVPALNPRTLDHSAVNAVSRAASERALPFVVIAESIEVGRRDLMAGGISSAYSVGSLSQALADVVRIGRTWSRQ